MPILKVSKIHTEGTSVLILVTTLSAISFPMVRLLILSVLVSVTLVSCAILGDKPSSPGTKEVIPTIAPVPEVVIPPVPEATVTTIPAIPDSDVVAPINGPINSTGTSSR